MDKGKIFKLVLATAVGGLVAFLQAMGHVALANSLATVGASVVATLGVTAAHDAITAPKDK